MHAPCLGSKWKLGSYGQYINMDALYSAYLSTYSTGWSHSLVTCCVTKKRANGAFARLRKIFAKNEPAKFLQWED